MNSSLTAIQGVKVGHSGSEKPLTGVTVVLFDKPYPIAVDAKGGWPSVYESESVGVGKRFYKKDAIFLSGGDVIGFDAAVGVRRFLVENSRDSFAPGELPSVTGAAIYDITDKSFYKVDYQELGYLAASNASNLPVEEGSVGAGSAATVGKLLGRNFSSKGGVGSYNLKVLRNINVSCLVVTNALGNIYHLRENRIIAGTRDPSNDRRFVDLNEVAHSYVSGKFPGNSGNAKKATTLAIVATDVALSHEELIRLANVANDGLARSIRPVHMGRDGDTIFAITTEEKKSNVDRSLLSDVINETACNCLSEAITRSVIQ